MPPNSKTHPLDQLSIDRFQAIRWPLLRILYLKGNQPVQRRGQIVRSEELSSLGPWSRLIRESFQQNVQMAPSEHPESLQPLDRRFPPPFLDCPCQRKRPPQIAHRFQNPLRRPYSILLHRSFEHLRRLLERKNLILPQPKRRSICTACLPQRGTRSRNRLFQYLASLRSAQRRECHPRMRSFRLRLI